MAKKKYSSNDLYEKKLKRVMERFGVTNFKWDYGRWSAWVQFEYQGQWHQFDHSTEKAQYHGNKLEYGSDCFAQIVLTLEDLARATNRGLYKLGAFLGEDLKMLTDPGNIPHCFKLLGFTIIPEDPELVKAHYRVMSKKMHPDVGGGSQQEFEDLKAAYDQALRYYATN